MSGSLHVVTLPGDGIGIEVMRESRKVLEAVCRVLGRQLEVEEIPCGGQYFLKYGVDWPDGSYDRCRAADVVLLGAVGWPDPEGTGPVTMPNGKMAGYSPVIGCRLQLQLYANVRPVKLYPGVQHKVHGKHKLVWEPDQVDMVIVRENTEGLYTGIGGRIGTEGVDEVATDTRVITRKNSERVIRKAFEISRQRNKGTPADGTKKVTALVKDNVLEGCRFFRDVFFEVAKDYPDIEAETAIIDAYTQWLVQRPEWYDVVVATNMFGDIVTDLASVLQGGMGMAVGCNVGDEHAMFEPIHGSAPKHAGKDRANPLAAIFALKEGLAWHGARASDEELVRAAEIIESCVVDLLQAGDPLTYDMVGPAKAAATSAVGDALAERVTQRLN